MPEQGSVGRWHAITRVLTSTVRAARLSTLQLTVAVPEVAVCVGGGSAPTAPLVRWPTRLPASDWHDELLLVASAPRANRHRRELVDDAALVVSELLSSEQRRIQAELLATRAIELAGVDALTQLGNRRTWLRAIEQESTRSARYRRAATVAVIDLDGLKQINDSEGHAAGDGQLRMAAGALNQAARSVDVVCRLGGDEFAILAPETGHDGAVTLVERVAASLAAAGVPASIGAATSSDGSLEQAWHEADIAMYRQKRLRSLV